MIDFYSRVLESQTIRFLKAIYLYFFAKQKLLQFKICKIKLKNLVLYGIKELRLY